MNSLHLQRPARGWKQTTLATGLLVLELYTYNAPQGDGNLMTFLTKQHRSYFTLTTPRKGMETTYALRIYKELLYTYNAPQGDENLQLLCRHI
ncbi:hypothetical protein AB0756_39070 [Tolypothrix campylonemoides VB511288_2]|uniref:Uncharacterized protein n=1 Tax=Tolypothrix campylonemoides VB511288_2 TaxID=3232311 RepID=A0ABW8XN42_9CYAN